MLQRLPDADRHAFVDGVRTYAPTFAAMFSWARVTGIAMSKSVLTVPQALGMSWRVYAGSSQLAMLPLQRYNTVVVRLSCDTVGQAVKFH